MHSTTAMPPPRSPHDSDDKTHPPESENLSESNDETAPTAGRSSSVELKRKEVKGEEASVVPKSDEGGSGSGREKLKRHRVDVAGRVWVPDMWGQEDFLKDWTDCAAADVSLVNSNIVLARDSLIQEARRATSLRLRIQNGG